MLIFVLIVLAGGCLAAGWLLTMTVLIYVALGISALGIALVVLDSVRRRRRARTATTDADGAIDEDADDIVDDAVDDGDTVPEPAAETADAGVRKPSPRPRPALPTTDVELTAESVVRVVAGGRRFHVAGCSSLEDVGESEELTVSEARAESFTPCTICVDEAQRTQLAGRR